MGCWTGDAKSGSGEWAGGSGYAAAAATTDADADANANANGSGKTYTGNRTVVWHFCIVICVSDDVLSRFCGDRLYLWKADYSKIIQDKIRYTYDTFLHF